MEIFAGFSRAVRLVPPLPGSVASVAGRWKTNKHWIGGPRVVTGQLDNHRAVSKTSGWFILRLRVVGKTHRLAVWGKIHINLDCFRLLQIFINSTFVFRRCGGTDWFGLRENKFVVAVFPLFESILGKQEHLGSVWNFVSVSWSICKNISNQCNAIQQYLFNLVMAHGEKQKNCIVVECFQSLCHLALNFKNFFNCFFYRRVYVWYNTITPNT